MQLPAAVGEAECPETLLLDRGRLVAGQNELQRLSLTAAALLIAAQLLAMKRLPPGTSSPENRRCRVCWYSLSDLLQSEARPSGSM